MNELERDLRLLRAYTVVSSLALAAVVFSTCGRDEPGTFSVIDVERINVRHPDGTLALAIAGKGRLPGPTVEGREYPRSFSGGRERASGMIFFNERGDEVGGLTFHGQLDGEGGHAASGHLSFDQFRQDQVVALQYQGNAEHRRAGLNVWDRSTEVSIAEILEVLDARSRAEGAARDSIERIIQGWSRDGLGAHRIFLGSADRTAALVMRDAEGRARIRLYVDSADAARIEFLDADGGVAFALPD